MHAVSRETIIYKIDQSISQWTLILLSRARKASGIDTGACNSYTERVRHASGTSFLLTSHTAVLSHILLLSD